jgi:hypothetical protein
MTRPTRRSEVVLDNQTVKLLSETLGADIHQLHTEQTLAFYQAWTETTGLPAVPAATLKAQIERILTIGKFILPSGLEKVTTAGTTQALKKLMAALDAFEKSDMDFNTRLGC